MRSSNARGAGLGGSRRRTGARIAAAQKSMIADGGRPKMRLPACEKLEDKPWKPDRVWNRLPDDVRQRVVMMALEQPELSPRELATRFIESAVQPMT